MRLRLSSSRLLRDSSPQGWPSIQPHLPLDFFLVGLLFPVVGLTAGALGLIFLAITLPCHAFLVSISSHTCRICSRRPQSTVILRPCFHVGNEHERVTVMPTIANVASPCDSWRLGSFTSSRLTERRLMNGPG
jgi:hypothetical protein